MIDELRRRAGGRVALLVGNGIHLFPNGGQSWNTLVERLALDNGFAFPDKAKNLAMPEFYDLIDLGRPYENGPKSASQAYPLKRQFCDGMDDWQPSTHHQEIVRWAMRHRSPHPDHELRPYVFYSRSGRKLLIVSPAWQPKTRI